MIDREDVKLNRKLLSEILDLIDKEEVLEVEDQIQKALLKESKELKLDDEILEKSPIPATPVTKEPKAGKEEFDEEIPKISKIKAAAAEELRDTAPVLKDTIEGVRTPPVRSTVPPPKLPPKPEGSKQL